MSFTPGVRLGAYEVLARIGAAGMGEVWRTRDTKLNRDRASKILPEQFATDPDRLARFKRKARGMRPLVLELVEGPTLADRIAPRATVLSSDTVMRDSRLAKAWLSRELSSGKRV